MSATLELRGIGQVFGRTSALAGIELAVPAGTFAVLLGPSGSGKTTLLSILGGFLTPTTGQVLIDGDDVTAVPAARRPTATVFQDYALFPHLSVGGNVAFGLRMRRVARRERLARVEAALALVGLAGFAGRRVLELSGGQRQRVALARALAVEPAVLLLDEPLGALDLALRRQVQGELKALQRRVGTTFLHVTHDQDEAMALADLLVVMNEGRIEDAGPPDRVYLRPRTRFAATFLGDSNLLEAIVTAAGGGCVDVVFDDRRLRLAGEAVPGAKVDLAVRPQQLVIAGGEAQADGRLLDLGVHTVTETVFLGGHWRVTAAGARASTPLLLHLPPAPAPRPGDRLRVAVVPEDLTMVQAPA